MGKYELDSAENREFLLGLRDNLLSFGHRFPSPGGGSYYLGDDGAMLTNTDKTIDGKVYHFDENGLCTNP